jgi:hypothetical protein
MKAAVASLWAAEVVRAATGSLGAAFERRSGSCCGRSRGCLATANRGADRQARSHSLIESVKTNVAILPSLTLTATTGSDEPSYGPNDTAVDGFWNGSNWESAGKAPLADTLASIMDSAPSDGAAGCAEEGRVSNCK